MVNICERLINVVKGHKPNDADTVGLRQKARGGHRVSLLPCHGHPTPPAKRADLTHPGIQIKHDKPVALPTGRQPQGAPTGLRVGDGGKSEGRAVTVRIGVAPHQGNITPRESGQTSTWSLITRALD